MKLVNYTILGLCFLVPLVIGGPANAWGLRCNPEEAREQYVCAFLLNCAKLGVTYQQVKDMTREQATDLAEKFIARTANYSVWEQLKVQGQSLAAIVPKLKEQQKQVLTVMIFVSPRSVIDIKTAPINDYQCKANITFNEEMLHAVQWGGVMLRFLDNPMSNILLFGFMTKDQQAFENMIEMQATQETQCVNHAPVYTEGLAFEIKDVSLCH